MKKYYILSSIGAVLLAGCGDNNSSGEEQNPNEIDNSNTSQNNIMEEEAEAILEESLEQLEQMENTYREIAIDSDADNPDISGVEKEWVFIEEDDVFIHREINVSGEEKVYLYTDKEDPEYSIYYEEGNSEAVRYESPSKETWFHQQRELFEGALEEGEIQYVREEEINGFEADVLEIAFHNVSYHWFDQDSSFEVRSEIDADVEGEGIINSNMEEQDLTEEILKYDVNPAFEESLFETPEEIELMEGTYEEVSEKLDGKF